jgi:hypothetical protein
VRRLAVAAAALWLCSGCYAITLRHGKQIPEAGAPRERWVNTFFGGLWQPGGPVQLDELCPQGVARIEQELSVANSVSAQLTALAASAAAVAYTPYAVLPSYLAVGRHLEVWTPVTVRVWCAKGSLKALKIAVVTLQGRGGIPADTAQLFTEALVAELRRQPGATVLSDSDIAAAIGLERQKQLLGCSETSCLTEIGGALGVDRLVYGSVGRVGESLVVTLTSLDPQRSKPMASVSERLKGKDEVFLDALPGMATQLMQEAIGR